MNTQILMGFLLLAFASTRFIQSEVMVSTMRKNGGWMYLDRITFDKGEPSINLNIDIIAIRKDGNNHR